MNLAVVREFVAGVYDLVARAMHWLPGKPLLRCLAPAHGLIGLIIGRECTDSLSLSSQPPSRSSVVAEAVMR